MRVLDLFSGLGGWSAAFKDRGHEVTTIDLDYRFNPTYCRNIGNIQDLSEYGTFDIILASPPCQTFSMAAIYLNWEKGKPSSVKVKSAIQLVEHTQKLLKESNPSFWVMENPHGMLRKIIGEPETIVDYCQYGMPYKKPTDLWGTLPASFTALRCTDKKRHPSWWRSKEDNDIILKDRHLDIHHEYDFMFQPEEVRIRAARINSNSNSHDPYSSALRAIVPYNLSLSMCQAAERELMSD